MNASTVFGRHGGPERPCHVEELVATQGVAGVAQEALEQGELARRQVHRGPSTATTDAIRRGDRPDDELRAGAAGHPADPSEDARRRATSSS